MRRQKNTSEKQPEAERLFISTTIKKIQSIPLRELIDKDTETLVNEWGRFLSSQNYCDHNSSKQLFFLCHIINSLPDQHYILQYIFKTIGKNTPLTEKEKHNIDSLLPHLKSGALEKKLNTTWEEKYHENMEFIYSQPLIHTISNLSLQPFKILLPQIHEENSAWANKHIQPSDNYIDIRPIQEKLQAIFMPLIKAKNAWKVSYCTTALSMIAHADTIIAASSQIFSFLKLLPLQKNTIKSLYISLIYIFSGNIKSFLPKIAQQKVNDFTKEIKTHLQQLHSDETQTMTSARHADVVKTSQSLSKNLAVDSNSGEKKYQPDTPRYFSPLHSSKLQRRHQLAHHGNPNTSALPPCKSADKPKENCCQKITNLFAMPFLSKQLTGLLNTKSKTVIPGHPTQP